MKHLQCLTSVVSGLLLERTARAFSRRCSIISVTELDKKQEVNVTCIVVYQPADTQLDTLGLALSSACCSTISTIQISWENAARTNTSLLVMNLLQSTW